MPHNLKLGRRPPKRHAALQLRSYLTGIVPAAPAAADYLAELNGGWDMLGNDAAGDCVAVTWANVRRLVTTKLTALPQYPTQAEVWQVYRTQNPSFDPNGGSSTGPGSSHDQGMDIQTLLEYLVTSGGPDKVKAAAFAQVDHTNPAEVKAAIALFGYVWTGINVLDSNMTDFNDGRPWDYNAASGLDGGHSVITGGYGAPGAGPMGGDERFITWAAETSFTDSFWKHNVEEAWVVLWPEHLADAGFLAGVNIAALAADYTQITGKPWPVTVTPPKPAPPAPEPVPPAPSLLAELVAKLEDLLNWLKNAV